MKETDKRKFDGPTAAQAAEKAAEHFRGLGVRFARSGVDARDAADRFGAALYAAVAKAELMGPSRETRGGAAPAGRLAAGRCALGGDPWKKGLPRSRLR